MNRWCPVCKGTGVLSGLCEGGAGDVYEASEECEACRDDVEEVADLAPNMAANEEHKAA